jgi:hypothetical protein
MFSEKNTAFLDGNLGTRSIHSVLGTSNLKNLRPLPVGNERGFARALRWNSRELGPSELCVMFLGETSMHSPGLYPASKGTDERTWRSSKTPNLKENLSKGVLWNR